jgi:hypothetical protein
MAYILYGFHCDVQNEAEEIIADLPLFISTSMVRYILK